MPLLTVPGHSDPDYDLWDERLYEVNHCHGPGRGHPCVGYAGRGSSLGSSTTSPTRVVDSGRRERAATFRRTGRATRATGVELPEAPDRYFIRDDKTHMVPLGDVETIRARPEGIANAEPYMRKAYDGTGGRRGPVTLTPKEGGGFTVLDGNSTVAIARKHKWKSIPAHILRTPGELAAFHKGEAEKKAAKAAKRAAAARAA